VSTELRSYVRGLGLDAYVVGGSVRDELLGLPQQDEDFLVPDVDQAALRDALAPYGRIEDLEVHGQLVGVRLHPSNRAPRALAPKGIEFTPARVERSTGPAHKDFAIIADGTVTIEADMARRDFTVNAIARRLADGELVDPFGGRADLERRELRTVTPESFADDPLRILRGLRLVSQLGFTLAPETWAQMERNAAGLAHVSPERIGGGLAADGMGELSKLLIGREPARALRIARDTGALILIIPDYAAAIGYSLGSPRQPTPLDEHLFAVVQHASEAGAPLEVLLAALVHDLGKPVTDGTDRSHAEVGARIARETFSRLRYPTTLRREVSAVVAAHSFDLDPWRDEGDAALQARRFIALHGAELADRLVLHKRADLASKHVPDWERTALSRLAIELVAAKEQPHRLADLSVDGDDLIALGFPPGPVLGEVLQRLLVVVVDDPRLNEREQLLAIASEALP
jgi:tRNA nucleotidyltransferase (CCA-adding enzyme)